LDLEAVLLYTSSKHCLEDSSPLYGAESFLALSLSICPLRFASEAPGDVMRKQKILIITPEKSILE
jgi:hypothetical protein